MHRRSPTRLLLLTGLVGPIPFAIMTVIVASLRPNYSHVNQFISELGEAGGQLAWAMNYLGFMLTAGLILVFVVSFRTRFPSNVPNTVGASLLAVFAVSMFLAGVFPCDAGCSPSEPSMDQKLHDLFSVLAFPAFTLGVFVWGFSLYRQPNWRRFGIYSLVTAGLSLFLLVTMVQSEASRDGTGTYQRLYLGVLFLWLMVMAVKLLREFGEGDA